MDAEAGGVRLHGWNGRRHRSGWTDGKHHRKAFGDDGSRLLGFSDQAAEREVDAARGERKRGTTNGKTTVEI